MNLGRGWIKSITDVRRYQAAVSIVILEKEKQSSHLADIQPRWYGINQTMEKNVDIFAIQQTLVPF